MKVARILALAAAMTLAVTSMSFAAGAVWFEATPNTPNATAGTSGPGQALDLGCDISGALRCDWLVRIMYQNFDGGAFSASIDVGTLNPADDGKFSIKSIQIPSSTLIAIPQSPIINGPDGALITSAGGGNVSAQGAPAGLYVVAQFVLSKVKLPGELNTSLIHARVGDAEFGGNDGGGAYEIVAIGPNDPATGYGNFSPWPYGALPGAVIRVTNTPEPATLGLIGLGVLALARRRK